MRVGILRRLQLIALGDPTARAGSPGCRRFGSCRYPVETEKLPGFPGVPLAGVFTSSRSPDANTTLPVPTPLVGPEAIVQVSVVLLALSRSVSVTGTEAVPFSTQ